MDAYTVDFSALDQRILEVISRLQPESIIHLLICQSCMEEFVTMVVSDMVAEAPLTRD